MGKYVLIESRDPFDSRDSEQFYDIAQGLTKAGNEVTLFLVQNGVLPARRESVHGARLSDLSRAKVTLLADSFSLRERGIGTEDLAPDVRPSDVDNLVDLLVAADTKAIWH